MKIIRKSIKSARPFATKDTSIIRSILNLSNAPVKKASLAEASVRQGKTTDEHFHKKAEEIYYFIQGKGTMKVEGVECRLKKGDAVLLPAGTRHKFANTGRDDVKILCCCAPPYKHSDTVITEQKYKLVIFDFDGTLVDSAPDIHSAANVMAKMYGIPPISKEKVIKAVGAGLNIFLKKVFPAMLKKMDILELRKDYIRIYNKKSTEKVYMFPGVIETLKYVRSKGIKTAIISNKASFFVRRINKHFGLNKYFSDVFGRGDFAQDKPHPLPFLSIMKKYGVKKSETLMVGDSKYDILGAKNAGIDALYLTYGYGSKKKVLKMKPRYVSNTIRKLKEII